jgi:hypothetical protein
MLPRNAYAYGHAPLTLSDSLVATGLRQRKESVEDAASRSDVVLSTAAVCHYVIFGSLPFMPTAEAREVVRDARIELR